MRLLGLLIAVTGVLAFGDARQAGAQTVDSLVQLLDAADWRDRDLGVAGLARMPTESLPPQVVTKLIVLLEREAVAPDTGGLHSVREGGEGYGEYRAFLTRAVLRFRDPRSLRGLARLGIQTSRDAELFVASQGSLSLPYLLEAWAAGAGRSDVVTTWARMLGRYPERLTAPERLELRRRILDADSLDLAWGAITVPFPEAAPVLLAMADATTDDILKARAQQVAARLGALRDSLPAPRLLADLAAWLQAFCHDESGHGREGCAGLSERLEAAARMLARGKRTEARKELQGFMDVLDARQGLERGGRGEERRGDRERDRGLFSDRAYLLLKANAQYLLARL